MKKAKKMKKATKPAKKSAMREVLYSSYVVEAVNNAKAMGHDAAEIIDGMKIIEGEAYKVRCALEETL